VKGGESKNFLYLTTSRLRGGSVGTVFSATGEQEEERHSVKTKGNLEAAPLEGTEGRDGVLTSQKNKRPKGGRRN